MTAPKAKLTVGAILSSQELINKINRLAKPKIDRVRTELVYGLDEAIPVGIAMENDGADVIISRRGTAELLRERLHIPVLALMANPMDIGRRLTVLTHLPDELPIAQRRPGGIRS